MPIGQRVGGVNAQWLAAPTGERAGPWVIGPWHAFELRCAALPIDLAISAAEQPGIRRLRIVLRHGH